MKSRLGPDEGHDAFTRGGIVVDENKGNTNRHIFNVAGRAGVDNPS